MEGSYFYGGGFGVLAQLAVAFALWRWGCSVASRRPGPFWRWMARAPFFAAALALTGAALTASLLAHTFTVVSRAAPSERATELARGISQAMKVTALFAFSSIVLYVACAAILFVGWLRSS